MSMDARAAEFANALRVEVRRFKEEEIPTVVRAAAIRALTACVANTPVDTGHARAGWIVSTDAPSTITNDKTDKQGQSTVKDGQRVIASSKSLHIFVSNNVEYIEVLDDGRIERPPGGEIETPSGFDGPKRRRRGSSGSVRQPEGILKPAMREVIAYIDEGLS